MNRRRVLLTLLTVAGLASMLVLGYLLSLRLVPTPQIAVVRVEGDIWGGYTDYLRDSLRQAAQDPAVSAVVLEIVSPGGEVTASEDLYFEILKLRESKPVIASIDEIAASGAYYIAAAADLIYAKPGSTVGNIGVISVLPSPDLVDDQLFTTGPFKLSGGSQVAAIRQMEMLKDTFLEAILSQRQDRLQVGPEVLSRGEVYLGLQAKQMGLVDEVGARGDAVAEAARMARVRYYDVVDRTPELPEDLAFFGFKLEKAMTALTASAPPRNLPPGFYFRYLEPPQ